MEIAGCLTNRVDPEQTSRSRASDLGLHCLLYLNDGLYVFFLFSGTGPSCGHQQHTERFGKDSDK